MASGIPSRPGTQSIERAVVLLKELAARGSFGWRLSDLAAHCELDKGTAHRILTCLRRERLVQQREADGHYLPGPLIFELSLTQPSHAEFLAACKAPLARLARRSGAVAFLYLRSGADFVCAAREGPTTLKGLSIHVGTRRPLITSSGGVAMLIALPEDEMRRLAAENLRRVARFGELRVKSLERMLRRSQGQGYGVNLGEVVPGIHSVGVAIRRAASGAASGSGGIPFAALTVSGAAADLPASGISRLMATLEDEAQRIGRLYNDSP